MISHSIRAVTTNLSTLRIRINGVNYGTNNRIKILRNYANAPKRFYKTTGILHCDGYYEVTLDHRKLKTPKGNVFKLENEILAHMVATEWDSQQQQIQPSTMHLTALCNTALENPNNIIKDEAIDKLLNYLETDTILFHSQNEDMLAVQRKEWTPIISWFCKYYNVAVNATTDLVAPTISSDTKDVIRRHLLSYNLNAIHGFNLAIDSLKSLILTLAAVERKINVDQAVLLSRLEEEFQAGHWGRVEWAHNINQFDLQTRVAAAIIFIHVNSMSDETKSKIALQSK